MLIQDPFLKTYPHLKKILKIDQQQNHPPGIPCRYVDITCLHTVYLIAIKISRYYRGVNYMKRFCVDLSNDATKINNCQEIGMISLTKKKEILKTKKFVIFAKKNSIKKKITVNFEISAITQENLKVLLIICVNPNIKHQKKCLWSPITVVIMTITP